MVLTFALGAAISSTVLGSKSPLSLNYYVPPTSPFRYSALYVSTPHSRLLERIQQSIPQNARVCATIFAATHFTHHPDCTVFPDRFGEADYVLVDVKARWSKAAREELSHWGKGGLPGFDPVWIEDGVFLFRRRPTPHFVPQKAEAVTQPATSER